MRKILVFEHHGLCSLSRIWFENLVSNSEVKFKLLGSMVQSLEQTLNQNRLRWLGHALRMSTEFRPRFTLFFETCHC